MITRCKFRCNSVAKSQCGPEDELFDVDFSAVYDGSEENKKFWKYTPAGSLRFSSVNAQYFVVGKEYYIDIQEANKGE